VQVTLLFVRVLKVYADKGRVIYPMRSAGQVVFALS